MDERMTEGGAPVPTPDMPVTPPITPEVTAIPATPATVADTPVVVSTDADTAVTTAAAQSGMKLALVFALGVALVLGGYFLVFKKGMLDEVPFLGGLDSISAGESVATVNGAKISRVDFENSKNAMVQSYTEQGGDATTPEIVAEIEKQALDTLISTELLTAAAKAGGFSATDAEVQTEYDGILERFGSAEALKTQMDALGMSEADLRADIRDQLAVSAYVTATISPYDLALTEEEITGFYDSLAAGGMENLPPLDEIRPQIEAQLTSGKQQTAVQKLIETLRAAATIEVTL